MTFFMLWDKKLKRYHPSKGSYSGKSLRVYSSLAFARNARSLLYDSERYEIHRYYGAQADVVGDNE